MTLEIFPDVEQRSDQWYEQRRGMVTASAVGQLLTPTLKVASNDVSRGLIALLTAERVTGWTEPTFVNSDMWRGIEHEPFARDAYAKWRGVEVGTVGFMVRTLPGGSRLGYSPDGLVGDDGLIEVKCPRSKSHLATVAAGTLPAQHMAQLQAGLLVSGRKWIDFVSFCGGMPLWVQRVTPDERWHEQIAAAVESFEQASERLASEYLSAVVNLPSTERIPDHYDVELKL